MAASIKCDERPFKGVSGGALPPQPKTGGSVGQRPPAKNISKYPSRNYRKRLRRLRGARASWPLAGALARSKLTRSRSLLNFRRPRRHFERTFSLALAAFVRDLLVRRALGLDFRSRNAWIFEVFRAIRPLDVNFRKKGEKNKILDSPLPAKWSHRRQDKPWEPCACFPDYGRGQALTSSN